jgi:CRISPR-associated protein Csa3
VIRDLDVITEKLPIDDFPTVTDRVSEILITGDPPVVCLGAGATDIVFPTFVAALAHREHIQQLMMFSDLERGGASPSVPDLMSRIPGRTTDVFRALTERMDGPPATVSELADEADRSVSTASRHIDALAEEGFVQKHRDEQSKTVSLTPTGRLFARNLLTE